MYASVSVPLPLHVYSPECVEGKFCELRLQDPASPRFFGASEGRLAPVEHLTLSTICCGAVWICTRVHEAAVFCARELLGEN